jgi:hypothetical protein
LAATLPKLQNRDSLTTGVSGIIGKSRRFSPEIDDFYSALVTRLIALRWRVRGSSSQN